MTDGLAMCRGAMDVVRLIGAPVFPCKAGGKQPATAHGCKDATDDPERIGEWWPEGSDLNVAMATGGVVVIDFDDHGAEGGPCGFDHLAEWEADHAPLNRETVRVKSGRGRGEHWYYRAAPGETVRNSTGGATGVDVRGEGGYVLVPPSIHPSGERYRYVEGHDPERADVAPLGDAERAFIAHLQAGGRRPGAGGKVAVGGRNNALFMAGIRAQNAGLPDGDVEAMMRAENARRFAEPLPEREVRRTIDSVLSYEKGASGDLVQMFRERGVGQGDMNDKELARLFADWTRGVLAYCPDAPEGRKGAGAWLSYDGRHWAATGAEQLAELHLKSFIDGLAGYVGMVADDKARQDMYRGVARYQGYRARQNVLADAKSELATPWARFDRNPHLLNVENGTIDLSGAPAFKAHDPADLITKLAPVRYDPDAKAPEFVSAVARAMQGDVSLIEYLQKLFGKAVAGDASDDCMHMFGERPRAGKGTVTAPLLELLGTGADGYARPVQPETLALRSFADGGRASGDLARLAGARLAVMTEPNKGMELDAERVKQLTGGDLVTARYLYGNDFSFRFSGVIVMQANNFPEISDPSVWDSGRVRVVPFDASIPPDERDAGLRARLCEPEILSGVLNWALRGVGLYRGEGFEPPEAVRDATMAYQARSDMLSKFLADCTEQESGALTTMADLKARYEQWCVADGRNGVSKSEFAGKVRARLPFRKTATIDGDTKRNVVVGVRLR